jgi:hypothetical protein
MMQMKQVMLPIVLLQWLLLPWFANAAGPTDIITEAAGRELADKGITIAIKDRPGSAVIVYKKKA